jgi:hypothetical protein
MAYIAKSYRNSFVLEQSKLNRLISILRERVTVASHPPKETYQVRHADGTIVTVESLERLYEFHNSGKKQIEQLEIFVDIPPSEGADSKHRGVTIEFTNEHGSGKASIFVVDPDPKWAAETFATIEEQVERSFKKGFMYTVSSQRVALLAALLSACITLLVLVNTPGPARDLATTMWLTKADIIEIATDLEKSSTTSQEQQLVILKRQLSNVRQTLEKPPLRLTWPILLFVAPLLIIVVAFIYLVKRCYPPTVFLWGDTEEWYQNILRHRSYVWNTILASTAVSILSGLFVLGIDRYFR